MKLEIRLFAGLECKNRALPACGQKEFSLEVPDGMTTQELIGFLDLRSTLPLITMVNGLSRAGDRVLADGDRIGIFPPVGGG